MTHKEMFSDARWLMPQKDMDAALFRSEFEAVKGEKAEITVSGLGFFILYINGKRVSNDEFVPAFSDYHDRPDMALSYPLNDTFSHRIYCLKYDIADYLCDGKNVIGIIVGGGHYYQTMRLAEGNMTFGRIKVCYKIDFENREVLSDKNAVYKAGFFKKSNLFHGEVLDYTNFDREWNTSAASKRGWKNVKVGTALNSEYIVQKCPSDKVIETLRPELVKNFGEYSVYKISKNITGYPVIRVNAGDTATLECAEEIFEDGSINNRSVGYGHQREMFTVTADRDGEYHPYFCWFGFQYFSLTNNAEPVGVSVIHADTEVTSEFECSDETLNWLADTFVNTQLCNMHGSIPSDCPHRERLGYTGDGQLTCNAVMTELDAESFYRKWIYDICDCQDKNTGHVQHTAPFMGGGGGPAGWGGAMINVPYTFYRHYGDKKFLKEVFPNMEKFAAYIESRCEDGLIVREEKDGWCLGDWCTPENVQLPEPFVNTTMFVVQLERLAELADVLGKSTKKYKKLIENHREAIVKKYYDGEHFCGGIQGADAFAIQCGLGDEKLLENLCKKYEKLGEFDTGIFGTYILLDVLYRNGKGALATKLLANKNEVSFETMRRAGATTLWENWNGEASHSHPMFGASTEYLFSYVLGIRQAEKSVNFDSVIISPVFDGLDYAKGYITVPHGKIGVNWKKENGKTLVKIEMCSGVNAEFFCGDFSQKLCAGTNEIIL